jgi:hypothetical protein
MPRNVITIPVHPQQLLTNAMELFPSRDANSFSAPRETTNILRNTEGSRPCSQKPSCGPYSGPDKILSTLFDPIPLKFF